MKQYGKVAVMMGGTSAEREVSLMSGSGVLKALQSRGVDAHAFDPSEKPLFALKEEGFDRVFIVPMAARQAGMSYEDLCLVVLDLAHVG